MDSLTMDSLTMQYCTSICPLLLNRIPGDAVFLKTQVKGRA